MDSIGSIRRLCKETKPDPNRFQVKLFQSAPEAFLLISDDAVLVEQYHYGKIRAGEASTPGVRILGGDMPVIEYQRSKPSQDDRIGTPYDTLKDHFEYVFKYWASPITDLTFDPPLEIVETSDSH
jgi:hypothetical protein